MVSLRLQKLVVGEGVRLKRFSDKRMTDLLSEPQNSGRIIGAVVRGVSLH